MALVPERNREPDAGVGEPHDRLVRYAFSEPEAVRPLLEALIPAELSATLDWSKLREAKGNWVDAHLKELRTDLLFECETSAGGVSLIFLHLEHQSRVDLSMPVRMLEYALRIWSGWHRGSRPGKAAPPVSAGQGPLRACAC